MGNPLRDRRTPQELAASGQVIEINEKINNFEQLARIVAADLRALDPDKLPARWRDAPVTGRVAFGFADAHKRVPALTGRVVASIDAVCQRCLEPFALPLSVLLRLVLSGDAGAASDGYERWELDEETLRPIDVIEESLIMALPLAAMHENETTCAEPDAPEGETVERIRPFANLGSQMQEENED